jgi:ketosteroid isomerase-like protein
LPSRRVVSGGRKTTDSHAADLAEIEKLRRLDVTATLSGDWATLSEAWADDVVILQQGQEPEVGKQAILAQRGAAKPGFRVVSYVPDIKDVTITDGFAFEWGVFTGSFVASPGGEEVRIRGKLLRIYRKEADGKWKAAVGMWNTSE